MSNLLSLFNQSSYSEMEEELENANEKIDLLDNKIEILEKKLEKQLEDFSKRLTDMEEEQIKNKKRIIDIYKYFKSTVPFGTISMISALDMIYKRFFNYTFTEKDSQKNIILLDYEELPERVALREREKNLFPDIY